MAKQKKDRGRPSRSGFAPKLRAFLAFAREEYEAKRRSGLPRNARQLAVRLTEEGESATDTAVRSWTKGEALPEARFIPHLERLLGAPFAWLDDPATTWPPKGPDALVFRLALSVEPKDRERVADALAAAMGRAWRP